MRRRLDRIDPATRRQAARRHVLPALAAVLRHVHGAIVGAGPDDAGPHCRFANAVERAVVLLAGDVASDRAAGDDLRIVLERGQVGRDRLPGLAAIGRDVHVLRAHVDLVGIVRRHMQRRDPLEAIFQVSRVMAIDIGRADRVFLLRADTLVEDEETALAFGIDDVVVAWFGYGRTGLAAAGIDQPRGRVLGAKRRHARCCYRRRVVLLPSIKPVRVLVVDLDRVQLGRRLVELRRPGLAAIVRNVGAAIVALDKQVRVLRVDPHVVIVFMRHAQALPGLAAVDRLLVQRRHAIDDIGILRVHVDVGVIERTGADRRVARDLFEGPALVHGLE